MFHIFPLAENINHYANFSFIAKLWEQLFVPLILYALLGFNGCDQTLLPKATQG